MTESWSIGPTVHFGSHSLLPTSDLHILWNLLQCKHCWFRRLYHQLAAKELQVIKTAKTNVNKTFISSSPFHSLTRAIQAVLHGFNLNRKYPTCSLASLLHLRIKSDRHHITLFSTKLCVKRQYWVCPSHGRQLFDLLYCDSDVGISDQGDGLDFSLTFRSILPQGHSDFFRSVQLSSSSDDSDSPEQTFSVEIHCTPELYVLRSAARDSHNKLSAHETRTCFTIPSRIQNKQLIEVNRKWSFMYNKNNLRAKNISGDEERSRRISDSYLIEEKPRVSKHHVHFPSGNPVSAVYNLRTYATASKLERSNRIWEIEARSRYFDRLKYLISEGYEPEIASQLAASDADDDKPISVTDSSAKKLNDLQLTTEPSKHPKTRRRKRHRKSRVNQVTAHPPHMHEPTASSLLANKTNCNHQKFVSLEPGLLH